MDTNFSRLKRWNTLCRLTSGTVVSYGVLMNFGALSFISDTRTITGMVRFLFVCFTVQLNWKENENYLVLNYRIHTFHVFTCKYSDTNIPTKTVTPWLDIHAFSNLLPTTLDTTMTIPLHPPHTYVNGNRALLSYRRHIVLSSWIVYGQSYEKF